ncbi:phosphoenolpyruvate--protein phosphotransferase [Allohahella sp. A8]|uniref:phosphoenolpyruvate--protein phosphotransferase n=1 Tax=Allohahella sp. A8 TaxID=3141461 RepID=UPI003A803501
MLEPLNTLREIFQVAADLDEPGQLLELIVSRVRLALKAEVCSIYLLDAVEDCFVLKATEGLDKSAINQVRLPRGEGLVGYIAEHQALLNVERASKHPNFVFFPQTGEQAFESFLGTPIVHFRKLIGVLTIQKHAAEKFTLEQEAFAITIAAQLAGPLDQSLDNGDLHLRDERVPDVNIRFRGVKGASGLAMGKALWLKRKHTLAGIVDTRLADVSSDRDADRDAEVERFRVALAAAKEDLKEQKERMRGNLPKDVLALYGMYRMILEDRSLADEIETYIKAGWTAATALRKTVKNHARAFETMEDDYLKAKAEDILHIGQRVYAQLRGEEDDIAGVAGPTILVGSDLSISDIAEFPTEQLAGIVCTKGSALSHLAILANALGVPAVLGVGELDPNRIDKAETILDGYRAIVIFKPVEQLQREYRKLLTQESALLKGLDALRDLPAETPDGTAVTLMANTGLLADITPGLSRGAQGIGLYRSEIPFMMHESFPSEGEQVEIYRPVLEAYHPKPVCMRTLDIGGDKNLPYFVFTEDNPFLGWRGIRFTLDNSSIFLSQIRAMLRANIGLDNLSLLLPMISRLDEVLEFRQLLTEAVLQLESEGYEVSLPKLGIMIEVPSAMLILDQLAEHIDFISIGSNDFTQYLLAVDRNNVKVSQLYSWFQPSVLRGLKSVVSQAKALGLPTSLCGEMAADPAAVILLMGMGIDQLSMSAYTLPKTKWVIRSIPQSVAVSVWNEVQMMKTESAIRQRLTEVLEQHGLGGLIRAGAH